MKMTFPIRTVRLLLAIAFLVPAMAIARQQSGPGRKADLKIWYNEAAAEWMKALPVGNGRLGAMVFGGVAREQLQLNEESVWQGKQVNNNNPDALNNLPEIRRLILDGKASEAMTLSNKALNGKPEGVKSYQPLGDLFFESEYGTEAAGYRRELDLRTGIHRVQYEIKGEKYTREVFASALANLIVMRLETDAAEGITTKMNLTRARDARASADGNELMLRGQIDGDGMKFETLVRVLNEGGKVSTDGDRIRISGARAITVLITGATDYNAETMNVDGAKDPDKICRQILAASAGKSFAALRAAHIADHRALMDRVQLSFGSDAKAGLPTNVRLEAYQKNPDDPGLETLLFQYGRYLLIGSSRAPGVLPANLQGIWNKELSAPWNADFHTNINLQMNYWPAELTNLPETVAPLTHFMQVLQVPGSRTAREMYGARGWTVHHLTDAFGHTAVHDGVINGMFPMGGPWMTQPIFEHYEFNGNTRYLKDVAYPMMKTSSEFVLDLLVPDQQGRLVTAPSYSPENSYIHPVTGKGEKLTYAPTMDMEIIHDLFTRTMAAEKILKQDRRFSDTLAATLKKIVPVKLAADGSIQEWVEDYKEGEPGHRHVSHLFALHPGDQITPLKRPDLFEGARKTLAKRLKNGGAGTGWSRVWTINFFARLKDGNAAHEHVAALLQKSIADNLFDLHPPFQIDGNFGYTAGVAEMLLQSQEGEIDNRTIELLPALPRAWAQGSVSGLKARGNFEISMDWSSGKLSSALVRSGSGRVCTLHYPGIAGALVTAKGKKIAYRRVSADQISFATKAETVYAIRW